MIANVGTGGTDTKSAALQFEPFVGLTVGPPATIVASVEYGEGKAPTVIQEISITVELVPQGGGYFVHVPSLPAGSTQGRTLEEAMSNVRENLIGLMEDVAKGELFFEAKPEHFESAWPTAVVRVPYPK